MSFSSVFVVTNALRLKKINLEAMRKTKNKKSLNGSFSLKNVGGSTLILNNEVAGFTLFYQVIYSETGDKIE